MPSMVRCPACNRKLRVPDDMLGRDVRCPSCSAQFVAALEPEEEDRLTEADGPRRRAARQEDDLDDDRGGDPRRRPERGLEPHRGPVILVLGIASLLTSCFPLGIIAWVMGHRDLKRMDAREMNPEGRGLTQAGWICGIIGTILGGIASLVALLYGVFFVGTIGCCCLGAAAVGTGPTKQPAPVVQPPQKKKVPDKVDKADKVVPKFLEPLPPKP